MTTQRLIHRRRHFAERVTKCTSFTRMKNSRGGEKDAFQRSTKIRPEENVNDDVDAVAQIRHVVEKDVTIEHPDRVRFTG